MLIVNKKEKAITLVHYDFQNMTKQKREKVLL